MFSGHLSQAAVSPADEELRYEPVHTVTEFHDLPLEGVAAFRGRPHCYRVQGRGLYRLWPIDDEAFHLALESWAIYVKLDQARQAGLVSEEGEGDDEALALPEDLQRYRELRQLLRVTLVEPQSGVLGL